MAKTEEDAPLIERILAIFVVTSVAASIVAFVIVMIASATGAPSSTFSEGIWPILTWISYVGLPAGLIAIIVLLIMNISRRSKQQKRK